MKDYMVFYESSFMYMYEETRGILALIIITLAICSESGLTEGSIVSKDLTRDRRGKGVSPSIDSDIRLV